MPNGLRRVAVRQSSVVVVIDGDEPDDFATSINDIRLVVGGIVDSLGSELPEPLRFEPTHANKDGNDLSFIQQGWPELRNSAAPRADDSAAGGGLQVLVDATLASTFIRHAIADGQRAIAAPDDTAFYSYRAIESLRLSHLSGEDDTGSARSESWETLRRELGQTRVELDAIKGLADRRRHGGHRVLTESDRRDCLLIVRKAIRAAARRATSAQ